MKILRNGVVYDTNKLEIMFDLDEDKPKQPRIPSTYSSTTLSAPRLILLPSGQWTNEQEEKPTNPSTAYIAKTRNDRFVILDVEYATTDAGNQVAMKRTILRFFKDKDDVVDYLSERYGLNDYYDKKLERFFELIGVKIEDA